jgi:hypothetical protein
MNIRNAHHDSEIPIISTAEAVLFAHSARSLGTLAACSTAAARRQADVDCSKRLHDTAAGLTNRNLVLRRQRQDVEERLRGGVPVVHTGSRELLKIDPSTSLVVWGGDLVRLRGGVCQEVLARDVEPAALAVCVLRTGFS